MDCFTVFMFIMASSIRRGIDVARAAGLDHLAASTGATFERAVQRLNDRGAVMKPRVATLLGGIALATATLYSAAPHAQLDLNPFGKYYENVARAAKQNDA